MKSSDTMKFAAAVLLFAAWGALVLVNKAPADQFVNAIALTIAGLGIHASTKSNPTDDVAVSTPVPAVIAAAISPAKVAPAAVPQVTVPVPPATPSPMPASAGSLQ
jgi:hypothetical protein